MEKIKTSNTIATGLAMFSMFFGAGNIVFPLSLGRYAQDMGVWAVLGLLITGISVPFIGLIAMILFEGKYRIFFERIGKVPGLIITILIMGLIGPFGATPRTVALSYSTMQFFLPSLSLPIFSFFACLVIFFLTYRRSKIVDILGYVLTPLLLLSLGTIIIVGFMTAPTPLPLNESASTVFLNGLIEGYNTMDLMGAFFFSSVIMLCLRRDLHPSKHNDYKLLTIEALKATLIGAGLLATVYVSFCFLTSFFSAEIVSYRDDEIIAVLAQRFLGPYAGIFACVAVSLACLTTAIALCAVFAEFLHCDICKNKIKYRTALIFTVVVTYFFSTLSFKGIADFLTPILFIFYPSLIAVSIFNLFYKLYNFKPIKIPVALVFILTLAGIYFK